MAPALQYASESRFGGPGISFTVSTDSNDVLHHQVIEQEASPGRIGSPGKENAEPVHVQSRSTCFPPPDTIEEMDCCVWRIREEIDDRCVDALVDIVTIGVM